MKDQTDNRLLSLDFFRGLTMFLLTLEASHLYHFALEYSPSGFFHQLALQFHHHPWAGLHFWDLIQPFFMFIVGVAMPFSYASRLKKGQSRQKISRHIFQRCLMLLMFGVMLHCGYNKKLVWELWNVLSQLSVTIAIAYLLMNQSLIRQFATSILLLIITGAAYQWIRITGYDEPYVMGHNLGSYIDTLLMGKINNDGWVAINVIPSSAHTIWGVIAGKIIASNWEIKKKLKIFIISGFSLLAAGYLLHFTGINPIIKRICTPSFILTSGGYATLALTICYWLIDIKKSIPPLKLFLLFGANSIAIYLFSNTIGQQWFNNFVGIFTHGFLYLAGVNLEISKIINSLVVIVLESLMLFWLYNRKLFFRI